MVFFVCNTCGTSLKKNKVDSHVYQCRGASSFSCIDCNKDFDLKSYNNHKECLQEDEKYGGANYQKPPPPKGKKKQEEWIQRVQEKARTANLPPETKKHIQALLAYDNLPRKKQKFINFVKNSIRGIRPSILDQLWDFFDSVRQLVNDEANKKPESANGAEQNQQQQSMTNKEVEISEEVAEPDNKSESAEKEEREPTNDKRKSLEVDENAEEVDKSEGQPPKKKSKNSKTDLPGTVEENTSDEKGAPEDCQANETTSNVEGSVMNGEEENNISNGDEENKSNDNVEETPNHELEPKDKKTKIKYMKWIKTQLKACEKQKMKKIVLIKKLDEWLDEMEYKGSKEELMKKVFEKLVSNNKFKLGNKYIEYKGNEAEAEAET